MIAVKSSISDESLALEDSGVFFIGHIEELADVIHIGFGHGLAVVLCDEEGYITI